MLIFTQIQRLQAYLNAQRQLGKSIGLVPTMGALHQGHLSLVASSKLNCDVTVCSIFINPTQFNNADDLSKYPRTIESDISMLSLAQCDIVFHPTAEEIYQDGLKAPSFDWGAVTNAWEGHFRPGHFDGVITVVHKLFDIVKPQFAFFGKKDFQQCAVINRMVQEFKLPIHITLVETKREPDGLAMSSRNSRLTMEMRQQALVISQLLFWIKDHLPKSEMTEVHHYVKQEINKHRLLKLEYFDIVNPQTLEPIKSYNQGMEHVALIALWCGNVRLIDNMIVR